MGQTDFEIRSTRRWPLVLAVFAVILVAGFVVHHFYAQRQAPVTFSSHLRVHFEPAMAGEQSIIDYVAQHIAPDYGISIESVGLEDPVQADRAVANGQYAATVYQHQWWLKQVVEANHFALTATEPLFQWAFGIYSERYSTVEQLPVGATIVIPDDGANQGQALWMLQRLGLIQLASGIEPRSAQLKDISDNPHHFKFKELSLLTMPRVLNSVDAAIGYVSQFDAGKVGREKGILFPAAPRTFASQLVVGSAYLKDPNIQKLVQAFGDKRLQHWLATTDDPKVRGVLVPISQR